MAETAVTLAKASGGVPHRPYGQETWSEKFGRKFRENPWVPLGCLATVGALVMSAHKMRAGKPKEMNLWMRARVGLQGVTLVALVAGTMSLRAKKEAEEQAANTAAIAQGFSGVEEQNKQREKEEFEARLQEAELAHSQEAAVIAKPASLGKVKEALAAQGDVKLDKEPSPSSSSTSPAPPTKSWWKPW